MKTCHVCLEIGEWCIAFNDASTRQGGGAGVVEYDPHGTNISLQARVICPNNEADIRLLL